MALQHLAYVANIVSAVCFVASLAVALYSMRRAFRTQRYSIASQLWDAYLARAIQYPRFAYPDSFLDLYDYQKKTFESKREEFERYEWFVSALLRTSEEVLSEFDAEHGRSETAFRSIKYHKKYLAWRRDQKIEDDYIDALSPKVRRLIDRVLDQK
jgi:hypothetical protein